MWEDDANKRGGRWLINLEKKQRNNELDRYWLDIVSLKHTFNYMILHFIHKMGITGIFFFTESFVLFDLV